MSTALRSLSPATIATLLVAAFLFAATADGCDDDGYLEEAPVYRGMPAAVAGVTP